MWSCVTCSVTFPSDAAQRTHYKGDWHRYNLRRRVAGVEALTEDEFTRRVELILSASAEGVTKGKCHLKVGLRSGKRDGDDAASGEGDVKQAFLKVESTGRKKPQRTGPKTCLFDSRTFNDIQRTLAYMARWYSFFLPHPHNIKDLESVLRTLRHWIEVEHRCLYCSRLFGDAAAVRKHMLATGHTKVGSDNEDLLEELSMYYTYKTPSGVPDFLEPETETLQTEDEDDWQDIDETQEIPSAEHRWQDIDELDPFCGARPSINHCGDLELANGRIAGNRALAHIYRQHLPLPQSTRASGVVGFCRESLPQGLVALYRYDGQNAPQRGDKKSFKSKARILRRRQASFVKLGVSANALNKYCMKRE